MAKSEEDTQGCYKSKIFCEGCCEQGISRLSFSALRPSLARGHGPLQSWLCQVKDRWTMAGIHLLLSKEWHRLREAFKYVFDNTQPP